MNLYSDRPPLYYTCTICHKCFSHTVNNEDDSGCPYCVIERRANDNKRLLELITKACRIIKGVEKQWI